MSRSPEPTRNASGRRVLTWRAAGFFLVVLFALGGAGLLAVALTAPEPVPPPQPAPAAAPPFLLNPPGPTDTPTPSAPAGRDSAETAPPPTGEEVDAGVPEPVAMSRSAPTRVAIPSIDVDAEVIGVGLDAEQRIEVPSLQQPHLAGWYRLGPSPGEIGNAVIVGHVDSRQSGPAVFFHLGALQPGELIRVTRADGTVAEFTVDGVAKYPKSQFPTDLVYGPADQAQLRLVTCGGEFDRNSREYRDNVIVFATLVDPSP